MRMFSCDLCKKEVDAGAIVGVRWQDMRQAACDGFDPFKASGIDMPNSDACALNPVEAEEALETWRETVMEAATDWRLCPDCAEAFRRATARVQARKDESAESRLSSLTKALKLLISPAGALIAIICFCLAAQQRMPSWASLTSICPCPLPADKQRPQSAIPQSPWTIPLSKWTPIVK